MVNFVPVPSFKVHRACRVEKLVELAVSSTNRCAGWQFCPLVTISPCSHCKSLLRNPSGFSNNLTCSLHFQHTHTHKRFKKFLWVQFLFGFGFAISAFSLHGGSLQLTRTINHSNLWEQQRGKGLLVRIYRTDTGYKNNLISGRRPVLHTVHITSPPPSLQGWQSGRCHMGRD